MIRCLNITDDKPINLRILDVEEIKTVHHTPVSHPFVKRLIGTLRSEFLDHVIFWNTHDLERKLEEFRDYYNCNRVHTLLDCNMPAEISGEALINRTDLHQFR